MRMESPLTHQSYFTTEIPTWSATQCSCDVITPRRHRQSLVPCCPESECWCCCRCCSTSAWRCCWKHCWTTRMAASVVSFPYLPTETIHWLTMHAHCASQGSCIYNCYLDRTWMRSLTSSSPQTRHPLLYFRPQLCALDNTRLKLVS